MRRLPWVDGVGMERSNILVQVDGEHGGSLSFGDPQCLVHFGHGRLHHFVPVGADTGGAHPPIAVAIAAWSDWLKLVRELP